MPEGKPAGVRCAQLTAANLCGIFGLAARPQVCGSYQASREYCGADRDEAERLLGELEFKSAPSPQLAEGMREIPEYAQRMNTGSVKN
ncbi:MAG: hypothetical protein A2010_14275 [Nitrospirae bacterium GWD2_57_9]|nr:MAG: hypothetical protein A2010_14275 [Nitrospirae bacterium GWD2_57_9]OGW46039.1 MAG: hypothetical protein A2078_11780 [Nitrospirae bacterium GWC2_57_9]